MKSFLKLLLLLLTACVFGQVESQSGAGPRRPETDTQHTEGGRYEIEGLPETRGAGELLRTLVEPRTRGFGAQQKPVAWLGGGAPHSLVDARKFGSVGDVCAVPLANARQAHLRTNGSADAHGSRA